MCFLGFVPFYKEAKKWQVICKEFDQRAEKMMQRLEILGGCQLFHAISVYFRLLDMQLNAQVNRF